MPPEDTCIFTSGGPAGVLWELKTSDDSLPGKNSRMAEVKELAYSRLQQELLKAQLVTLILNAKCLCELIFWNCVAMKVLCSSIFILYLC